MNTEKFIKTLYKSFDMQRQNIDQFFASQKATITDLYRINQSLEHRKVILNRLNHLLRQREFVPKESPEYARIMSEIAIETGMLNGVIQDNQKQLESVKSSSQFQLRISDKMLRLKKEISKILGKLKI